MEYQGLTLERLNHSGFLLKTGPLVIYFDPYQLKADQIKESDYVFISHAHFDHCSTEDLQKIVSAKTTVVASAECQSVLAPLKAEKFVYLKPGQTEAFQDLRVIAVQAYNINKFKEPGTPFHLPDGDELGYVIEIFGVRLYHAGDTDNIPEMSKLKNVDLALLPVSGTYVMTPEEAVLAAQAIKPKIAIPMHYGSLVGTLAEAEKFKDLLKDSGIKVEIL